MKTLAVGDRVKLTGKFLRSTGQATGSEGRSVWTVKAINGSFVVTDELMADASFYFTPAELEADPSLKFRRINAGNLYKVGTVDIRNCP